jgi:primary-amine oxidase
VPREALAVVLDNVEEKTYEVVVALSPEGEERVLSCVHIPEVQPPILSSEYELCEDIVKRDPRIIAFLKKRGIKRKVKIMVDLWIGFFSHPQNRIGTSLFCWIHCPYSLLAARKTIAVL